MSIRIPFFNNRHGTAKDVVTEEIVINNVPEHVAIIMDGNGRWANRRGLPRVAGHKEGMEVVQRIVRAADNYKIKILTMYAFSTENWRRPKSEVDYLMRLPKLFLNKYLPELIERNVKVNVIGDLSELPPYTKEAVDYAMEKTKKNTGLLLNFALNYGGRSEIVKAVKQIMNDVDQGVIKKEEVSEELFEKYLYTHNFCDPDLIIRTSGEKRISNFLLWQSAYSEFWFTDVLWPDFTEETLTQALREYQTRLRRFGGV